MNSVKGAPTSSALSQVSHCGHTVHAANHHLRGNGERNGAQR